MSLWVYYHVMRDRLLDAAERAAVSDLVARYRAQNLDWDVQLADSVRADQQVAGGGYQIPLRAEDHIDDLLRALTELRGLIPGTRMVVWDDMETVNWDGTRYGDGGQPDVKPDDTPPEMPEREGWTSAQTIAPASLPKKEPPAPPPPANAAPRRPTARERRQTAAARGAHNLPGENLRTTLLAPVAGPLLVYCDPSMVFLSRERRDDDGRLHVRARLTPTGGGQVRVATLMGVTRDADGRATDFDDRGIGLSSSVAVDLAAELTSFDVRSLHEAHSIELLAEVERDVQELFLSAATGSYSISPGRMPWPLTIEDEPPGDPPLRAVLTAFTRVRSNDARVDLMLEVTPKFDWAGSLGLDFELKLVDEEGRPLLRDTRGSTMQPHRARVLRARLYDIPHEVLARVRGVEVDVKAKFYRWESLGVFKIE